MFDELQQLGLNTEVVEWIDIDQLSEHRALYGAKIPVLEYGGEELASGRLDEQSRARIRQIL